MFDLGKVLIDFDFGPLLHSLKQSCLQPDVDLERVVRDSDLAIRYEIGAISTAQFHEHLCTHGGLRMALEQFRGEWSSVFAPELLVSEALLQTLKQKYPLILLSNTNEAHAAYIAE